MDQHVQKKVIKNLHVRHESVNTSITNDALPSFENKHQSLQMNSYTTLINGLGSFISLNRLHHISLENSFIIDQENAKQFERIQVQTRHLKDRQNRLNLHIKKLTQLLKDKQFQLKNVQQSHKLTIDKKNKQILSLIEQNKSLKQQVETLKNLSKINQYKQSQQWSNNKTIELQRQLKQKEKELQSLAIKLKQIQILSNQGLQELVNSKHQIQIYQEMQKRKDQIQLTRNIYHHDNIIKLQQKIQEILIKYTLKTSSQPYQVLSSLSKQVISIFTNANELITKQKSDQMIQNILSIVEQNLLKLNEYFKQKADQNLQRMSKYRQYMNNAQQIVSKHEDDYYEQSQGANSNFNSPQRFNFQNQNFNHQFKHYSIQSSNQSYKKSILLQQDLDNAINMTDQIDNTNQKQQALQAEMKHFKETQVSAINQNSHQDDSVLEKDSNSSISKSKLSNKSQSQRQDHYKKIIQNAKLNAKLKKKKR